jgi:hypothetical protein
MNKFIFPLTIIMLVIVGVVGWSFLNKPTSIPITNTDISIQKITPTATIYITPEVTETLAETSKLTFANPSVAIDSFSTSIPAKKYSDMAEYMTPNVTIIKYGTSCCGLLTKAKAINEMSYLNGAFGPWNFADNNPLSPKFTKADPDNFQHAFIGTSANNYAVGLELNDNYLITKVILVGDYRLITGQ